MVTAIGVTAISAIVAWRCHGQGGDAKPGATAPAKDAAIADEKLSPRQRRAKARRMVSPVAAAPASTGRSEVGKIIAKMCDEVSPRERCAKALPLADRCEAGDAAACVQAAELYFQVPVQPYLAIMYLGRACKLGDAAACERERRQLVMAKWPKDKRDGDLSPAEACDTGDPLGCFYDTFKPSIRGEPLDTARAWKACVAGIADSCATVAQYTDDPRAAVQALEVACKARSPLHCGVLASMHDDGAVCCEEPLAPVDERGGCLPCPDFDRSRAQGYAEQVLTLTGKPYDPRYEDPPAEESEDSEEE